MVVEVEKEKEVEGVVELKEEKEEDEFMLLVEKVVGVEFSDEEA